MNRSAKRRRALRGPRRLLGERLEPRRLLDAAGLLPDHFFFLQNDGPRLLDVLANDGLALESSPQITAVSFGSQGGRIRIADDGSGIWYTPPADFAGEETFTYFVGADSATVTLEISPLLADDAYRFVPDGSPRSLDVLANDPFSEDYVGPRIVTLLSETSLGGEVTISPGGKSLEYQMAEGLFGEDTFVYIVDERFPARVTIQISNPLVHDRVEMLQNDEPWTIDVLGNDPFYEGYAGERSITHVLGAPEGSVAEITDEGGSIRFRPPQDFAGGATLTYVVDSRFEMTLQIAVRRPAVDDHVVVDQDSTEFFINVTANDRYYSSDGRLIDVVEEVTSVGDSERGAVIAVAAGGQGVLYTPPPGFVGTDTYEYVADGRYPATVRVQVTEPVRRDSPVVYHDTVDNVLDVLANDFLGHGYDGPQRITGISATSAGGTVTIAGDGRSLVYTPPDLEVISYATDTMEYTVDDRFQARVDIRLTPNASPDHFEFGTPLERHLDVLANDHFPPSYSGAGVITGVSQPSGGGSVQIVDGGRALLYSPGDGRDEFTYSVDGRHEASVAIFYPRWLNYDHAAVDQNSDSNGLDLLANDFQSSYLADRWGEYGGPRLITAVDAPEEGGVVTISDDGKHVSYTPAPDFHGQDRFTYRVDGYLEAAVTVNVIRRVRDDRFHVDPGSSGNLLAVLVNDLFSADYAGGGLVTAVTESAAGAELTVSGDGAGVLYTPHPDFRGEDSFTYTVDGNLKAHVTVFVQDSHSDRLRQFEELAEIEQFLLDDALQRYATLFSMPGGRYDFAVPGGGDALALDDSDGRVHSDTNVQVTGVDEADIIETDGTNLYTLLTSGELVISQAWPADELEVLSRFGVRGTPIGQYLNGDRLAIVSQLFEPIPYDDLSLDDTRTFASIFAPYPQLSQTTVVTVLDVADPADPLLIQEVELDGSYVQSRRMGDFVFLVLNSGSIALPAPFLNCEEESNACAHESRDEYVARVQDNFALLLEELLPQYTGFDGAGDLIRDGVLVQAEDIFRPLHEDGQNLLSVLSIDMSADEPGLAATSGVLTAGATDIYGSLEHLYVFEDHWNWDADDRRSVEIIKFAWDDSNGSIDLVATGAVAGYMADQFSVDEHDGYLRIATTVSNTWSGNFTNRDENVLFVLEDDHGVLEFVGSLRNLALGEEIKSVRFFGDRAFAVTFRQIDPLFGLDLSDPVHPRAVGHLTMHGFSDYMQFVTPDRLLAVGRNTPTGFAGPVMVSLFNVADLTQPILIDQFTLPRFSTSEASVDHHAFTWFGPRSTLAIPSSQAFWERTDADGDGYRESRQLVQTHELYAFRIDTELATRDSGGIDMLGTVAHDDSVRRSAVIEDVLYSVSNDAIRAVSIDDPSLVLGEVALAHGDVHVSALTDLDTVRQKFREYEMLARSDLAGRLGIEIGATMVVASEAHQQTGGPLRMVLRAGERHFVYHATASGVVLVDDTFSFANPGDARQWQNPLNAYDVSGDGHVSPVDVLYLINDLNLRGARQLPTTALVRQIDSGLAFLDPSGDGAITPLDALRVINFLNDESAGFAGEGEGEPVMAPPPSAGTEVPLASSSARTAPDGRVDGPATAPVSDAQRSTASAARDSSAFGEGRERPPPSSSATSLDDYLAAVDAVFGFDIAAHVGSICTLSADASTRYD